MPKKVAVALSGGIDSAVSAYLLKKQGFQVEGFFLKLKFDHPCLGAWRESEGRAIMVAGKLKVPLHTISTGKEFEEKVWEPFWTDYKKGLTPNPCPSCNLKIKFGFLLKKVKELGFDFLATGHYARLAKEKGIWKLARGIDDKKDQSYFLYRVPRETLRHLIFPLGKKKKSDIKKIAKKIFGKKFAETPESQELCFVSGNFKTFSRKILPVEKGKIKDLNGQFLGYHDGIWFFTQGQKMGLSYQGKKKPVYVVSKNAKKNELVVRNIFSDSKTENFKIKKTVWQIKPKGRRFESRVQLRYKTKLLDCEVSLKGQSKAEIVLKKPQSIVTPGQSAVFYEGDMVIGGGEIM